MSEHTKGPWFYSRQRSSIGCAAGWIVGPHWHDHKSDGEFGDQDSDGMLIAAAPDLLEACENALTCIEAMADRIDEDCGARGCMCTMPGNIPHSQTYRDGEIAMLRAAIAKVRGEVTP